MIKPKPNQSVSADEKTFALPLSLFAAATGMFGVVRCLDVDIPQPILRSLFIYQQQANRNQTNLN